ncbi:MAG TPA: aminoacyl-tRNA deacylase [Armatimonadaceae bacterium]|nr:aminoacyl-tRNA deacylase [Armatimonadaceae bacterium]
MAAPKYPVTPAVRALRAAGVAFDQHLYDYEEHGGTERASRELGVDEHGVVKTIVMQTDEKKPLLILMHGDRAVGPGLLAKALGAKSVTLCDPATAQKHTGYLFGGTSPLGTRVPLPVYVERTILDLPQLFVNGGKRGFLVSLTPHALRAALPGLTAVDAAAP